MVPIPTNRPLVRADEQDLIYKSEEAKFNAVIDEIAEQLGFGAHGEVGEQHPAKRTGADALDFDDSKPVEWSHSHSSDSARRNVIDARFS